MYLPPVVQGAARPWIEVAPISAKAARQLRAVLLELLALEEALRSGSRTLEDVASLVAYYWQQWQEANQLALRAIAGSNQYQGQSWVGACSWGCPPLRLTLALALTLLNARHTLGSLLHLPVCASVARQAWLLLESEPTTAPEERLVLYLEGLALSAAGLLAGLEAALAAAPALTVQQLAAARLANAPATDHSRLMLEVSYLCSYLGWALESWAPTAVAAAPGGGGDDAGGAGEAPCPPATQVAVTALHAAEVLLRLLGLAACREAELEALLPGRPAPQPPRSALQGLQRCAHTAVRKLLGLGMLLLGGQRTQDAAWLQAAGCVAASAVKLVLSIGTAGLARQLAQEATFGHRARAAQIGRAHV